ncbi:hypothetical protein BKA65DRAFT_539865 [Rhexocercosporidium sp. MPI-PUGE-AT-0058]|nr:hypothetical protein BKA65DRAFT_539865 [Rhexocercosporidium sp. MPI-PUGE-AT-0058]
MALFYTAKAVEKLAVLLRLGEFEVQPNWQCPSCATTPTSPLCTDCRASWVHEVQNLDYSDAYEARLSRKLGVMGLVTGLSGWAANVGLGLFEFGDMIGGITAFILWFIPGQHWLATPLTIFFSALFSLSVLALMSLFLVSGFIMAMNPTGARHWRHMTPQMYAMLGVFALVETLVITLGVSIMDILVIVGPLMMSGMGFMVPFCMRTPEEVEVIRVQLKKDKETV